MIKPTVGRVVWFTPQKGNDPRWDVAQPLCASVVYVHGDRCINIAYFDPLGGAHSAVSVPLLQDDDAKPEDGYFCSWMPYQKGQAAKAEQLEKQIASGS
jgi:hypothetical protein